MTKEEAYLKRLIGKLFVSAEINTNTIVAINEVVENGKSEILTLSNTLFFEDYRLNVYNPISVIPADKIVGDLIGCKVTLTDERLNEAEIQFDNGYKLIINMRDEVYFDPEARCLYGPNNFWVVWN